jgi:hypothetical protein
MQISQMELPGGSHPAQNSLFRQTNLPENDSRIQALSYNRNVRACQTGQTG